MKENFNQILSRVTKTFLGEEAQNNMYRRLAKSAAGTFGQRVGNMVLMLLTSLLLARLLGLKEYGIYSYVQAWISLLVIPAICGMDQLVVRNVAAYNAQSAWGLLGGLLRRVNQIALSASLIFGLLAAGYSWALVSYWDVDPDKVLTFLIALLLLPLTALVRLRQAAMNGLHHIVKGQLPEKIFQPALFILLVAAVFLFWKSDLAASEVMWIKVGSFLAIFLVGARMLFKVVPSEVYETQPTFQTYEWLQCALPLLFASGLHVVNSQVSLLMLGAISGTDEVGVLLVANRLAGFIVFFLGAFNIAVGPTLSKLYSQGEMIQMQQLVTKGARVVLCLATPVAGGMIVFGYWFLLPFGEEFTVGQFALAIFSLAQLVNVATGPVGTILIMTGHERDAAISVGASVLMGIGLNAILIPLWGINGAALAGASSLILWNILLAVWVQKRLGIHPTALGIWGAQTLKKTLGFSSP